MSFLNVDVDACYKRFVIGVNSPNKNSGRRGTGGCQSKTKEPGSGIVAKVGDLVLDGSIRTQLTGLNESIKGSE